MPSCLSLFVYLSHKNLLLSSYSSAPMNDDDNDSSSNLTPHELESSDEESDVDERRNCNKKEFSRLEKQHYIFGGPDQSSCIMIIPLPGGHYRLHQKSDSMLHQT